MSSASAMAPESNINNYSSGTKKFIRVVLAVQLAMLGLVGLARLDFDIPIGLLVVRQIIGFIYLTFIPGLLILYISKLHKMGGIETLLYSVGLSIAFVMFLGFFMSTFYPFLGISRPISIIPLLLTLVFVVLILSTIAYKQERSDKDPIFQNISIQWSDILSPPALFLFLFPLLTIIGASLVNMQKGNTVLYLLLSLIALVPILVAFNKFIPLKLYPLAVVLISISLNWHWSLISPGLVSFDIHHHYWLQKLIISNSNWNPNIMHAMSNSMLSVTILAPIYSLILNLDTVWIFKIVYSFLVSLIPLALFQAYKKQIGDKIAFLGTFFFMSFPAFFSTLATATATQPIAEVFLALSILVIVTKRTDARMTMLLLIFSLSIVVSHYSASYIYMAYLVIAWAILRLLQNIYKSVNSPFQASTLSIGYVGLFIVFCIAWYMYTSLGASFDTVIRIGDHIYSSLRTEFLSPAARDPQILQATGLAPMRGIEVTWQIARYIQYIIQLFIIVGIVELVINLRRTKFHAVYVVMTLVSAILLALAVVLPYFTATLSMARIYHLTLFFLAPVCILGGKTTFRLLSTVSSRSRSPSPATVNYLGLVALTVLVPYFLFTSGFIFDITGSTPTSMPLSASKTDWGFFTKAEISARDWVAKVGDVGEGNFKIYADAYGTGLLYEEFGPLAQIADVDTIKYRNSLIFLRHWNVAHNEMLFYGATGAHVFSGYIDLMGDSDFSKTLRDRSKIFNNGWAQILR